MDLTDVATKIARLEENQATIFRRVEKNENLLTQIHKMSASMDNLADKLDDTRLSMEKIIQGLEERTDKTIENVENRLKSQGERLGELEKKGGKKLEAIVTALITAAIAALIFYFTGQGVI